MPFGRDLDWTDETFRLARDSKLEVITADDGVNIGAGPFIQRLPADARRLSAVVDSAAGNLVLKRFLRPRRPPERKLTSCSIYHLMTGDPFQVGGAASVVNNSLKLEQSHPEFQSSAIWVQNARQSNLLVKLKTRVVARINRMSSRDPHGHPYRFPHINNQTGARLESPGKTVLHVHKASLWKHAARWKANDPDVALVFHVHSVEGFTGGCVLESDCPMLARKCQDCPIIQPYGQILPVLGWRYWAKFLRSAAPLIIANSQATYRALAASGIFPNDCRVEIVPPSIDPISFYRELGKGFQSDVSSRV